VADRLLPVWQPLPPTSFAQEGWGPKPVDAVAVDQPYPAYHRHEQGSGHVWQGRFKAFPVHEVKSGSKNSLNIEVK
jgi:hypothetical protein